MGVRAAFLDVMDFVRLDPALNAGMGVALQRQITSLVPARTRLHRMLADGLAAPGHERDPGHFFVASTLISRLIRDAVFRCMSNSAAVRQRFPSLCASPAFKMSCRNWRWPSGSVSPES